VKIKAMNVDRINGYRRSTSGVFVSDRGMIVKMLAEHKIPSDEKYPYLPQGRELEIIERARKLQQAVLLVGPTGVGKRY
jgi:flagellar biosynthesis GTPase FlhF